MIVLTTSDSVVAKLSNPVNENNPTFYCSWVGTDNVPGNSQGEFDNENEVTLISAPTFDQKLVDLGIIYNNDTDDIEVTLQIAEGTDRITIAVETISAGGTFTFGKEDAILEVVEPASDSVSTEELAGTRIFSYFMGSI